MAGEGGYIGRRTQGDVGGGEHPRLAVSNGTPDVGQPARTGPPSSTSAGTYDLASWRRVHVLKTGVEVPPARVEDAAGSKSTDAKSR